MQKSQTFSIPLDPVNIAVVIGVGVKSSMLLLIRRWRNHLFWFLSVGFPKAAKLIKFHSVI